MFFQILYSSNLNTGIQDLIKKLVTVNTIHVVVAIVHSHVPTVHATYTHLHYIYFPIKYMYCPIIPKFICMLLKIT